MVVTSACSCHSWVPGFNVGPWTCSAHPGWAETRPCVAMASTVPHALDSPLSSTRSSPCAFQGHMRGEPAIPNNNPVLTGNRRHREATADSWGSLPPQQGPQLEDLHSRVSEGGHTFCLSRATRKLRRCDLSPSLLSASPMDTLSTGTAPPAEKVILSDSHSYSPGGASNCLLLPWGEGYLWRPGQRCVGMLFSALLQEWPTCHCWSTGTLKTF